MSGCVDQIDPILLLPKLRSSGLSNDSTADNKGKKRRKETDLGSHSSRTQGALPLSSAIYGVILPLLCLYGLFPLCGLFHSQLAYAIEQQNETRKKKGQWTGSIIIYLSIYQLKCSLLVCFSSIILVQNQDLHRYCQDMRHHAMPRDYCTIINQNSKYPSEAPIYRV